MATALCAFQGHLLVGISNIVRMYDLGKKKLLRKLESKASPAISLHSPS
jgi:splicing factor 3B subunit 3